MTTQTQPRRVIYPDSDGQPMSDNTIQFRYITTIQGGLDLLFCKRPDVFVAGDLLWYPVEGQPKIRTAPDVMVVLGRPKGDRGSYRQWEEDGVAPQVVFEVISPGNDPQDLRDKDSFYQRYGVEEYYAYDPGRGTLDGWLRVDGRLQAIVEMNDWKSPRLGVCFKLKGGELELLDPSGRPMPTYVELGQKNQETEQRAEQERLRAEKEHERAEQQQRRAESLAARLRALGLDPGE